MSISIADLQLWIVPIIGAFIGWITNWIAIKMLFHPRKPYKFLFLTFHGIFPKNKHKIAQRLGGVVQKDLINFNDIKERLKDPDSLLGFTDELSILVDNAIHERLEKNPLLRTLIPEPLIQNVQRSIVQEIENAMPQVLDKAIEKIESKLNIEQIVTEKVNKFSDEKLEDLLLAITAKEFKFIEIIGGVLGFLIGIIQLIIARL
jgi:uncharacterized membrane protein YheB (UPF0754 family)